MEVIEQEERPTIADIIIGKEIKGFRVKDRICRIVFTDLTYLTISGQGEHLDFNLGSFE